MTCCVTSGIVGQRVSDRTDLSGTTEAQFERLYLPTTMITASIAKKMKVKRGGR